MLHRSAATGEIAAPVVDGLVYAWVNGSIRPAHYRALAHRTGPSATRDLQRAVEIGYLVASGETRTRRYLAGPKLQAVRPVPIRELATGGRAKKARWL